MKRIQIAALCLLALAGVCAGCSDDDAYVSPQRKHAEGNIVLRIGTGSKTRTRLEGSYNLHHVRQVYAILYEGTGDVATYVCHHDLDWSPIDSTDYAEGVVQEKAFEFGVSSTLKSGGEYTLLCVGLDDQSGATYGLTLDTDAETAPSFLSKGKTLADAQAILATGKTMTAAELFAGWESFTYSREDENSVTVELTRRVSGAYAYVKDIPVKINGTEVKAIQWVLGNTPPTQIGLKRVARTADDMRPDDFGSVENTAADSKILDKLTLTDDIVTANATTNLYDIKEEYTDALGLTANTLLLSAYLLPMEAGANGTLAIELLDGEGDVVKRFPALWDNVPTDAGDEEKYSVYPNYVYHVGTRSEDSDRPASLAGERIELVVQPWTELTIDTEFPKVPLEATIDYDKNQSSYIYDCINTTDKMTIMPSLLKRTWTMTLVAEDKDGNIDPASDCDWIYFVKDGGYTQTLKSSDFINGNEQAVEVTFRLNDYVEKRTFNPSTAEGQTSINEDWRRARIVLTTTDAGSSPAHISIRQYNAITVYVGYNKKEYPRGFSRYDYGVKRDEHGEITDQGHLGFWGYWSTYFNNVYDVNNDDRNWCDGEFVYYNINKREGAWGNDATPLSSQPIVRYSKTDSWEWNGTANPVESHYWYLPAQYELGVFFRDIVSNAAIVTNIKPEYIYWSSTAREGAYKAQAYCQKLNEDGTPWVSGDKSKSSIDTMERKDKNKSDGENPNYGYSRRARHFKD